MINLYEHADYCLRVSLYCTGKVLQDDLTSQDNAMMAKMMFECNVMGLWPCKSLEYRWSNSGSANPADNTLLKRPTYWIYHHVLKYINLDPYKGLNGDQMRALFTYLYVTKDQFTARWIWSNFKTRLGMFPSLMEHFIFKPQTMVLLFDLLKDDSIMLKLLAKLSRWVFERSVTAELKVPVSESTTNKISMLPTMKLLGMTLPSEEYVREVYSTYWDKDDEASTAIRESLIDGLLK